jgi:hypothetical protein
MIVFLLLLLILVGLIFYYVRNKSGPERPLKEGFELVDADVGKTIFYYGLYRKYWESIQVAIPQWNSLALNTSPPSGYDRGIYRPATVAEQNYYRRQKGITLADVDGIPINLLAFGVLVVGDPTRAQHNGELGQFNFNSNQIQSIEKLGSQGTAVWEAFYISYVGVEIKANQKQLCMAAGNVIAQRDRSDFTITDDADGAKIGKEKSADQAALSRDCSGAIINGSVTFSRSCNALANETYKNIFFKYGIAFNVANLSLFDGCNITDDLTGDAQAAPPIPGIRSYGSYTPQPGPALIVSRELSNDGTGSIYTIRPPATARYPIGGGKFADPRQSRVFYKIEIYVMNGNREVFDGAIEDVEFIRPLQLMKIAFIDGTGFVIDGMTNKKAATTTYHETAGDVATFTISTYADKSYDERYNYYSNSVGTATASEGFLRSTNYFPIYTGTVGNTVADASGNAITFRYDETDKTTLIGSFSIMSAGQQVTRRLGQGSYTIFINNEQLPSMLQLSELTTIIDINTKTGQIMAYATTPSGQKSSVNTLTTPLIERADVQQFTMQIRDASGQFIYFMTPQPVTIIGTRYPPTTAPAASTIQECFLIQQTDSNGTAQTTGTFNEALIEDICANFDGRLATVTDLQADLAAGADWCTGGWIQVIPALRRVAWPVTTSMSKPNCLPASNKSITTNGTVVITQASTSNGIICYGTKPANDITYTLTINNASYYFNIVYFNKFKDQWSRKSTAEKMEVFAVEGPKPVRQAQDICMALGYVRATKAQLDEVAGDSANTADMTIPAFVADDSVRAFTILNESAAGRQAGVNGGTQLTVNANYCYGQKPQSRTIQGPDVTATTGAATATTDATTNVTYKIIDYNARRRVWSKYSDQPYKTYNLVNRTQIANETNAYRKAALIVNDIQTSGVAAVKKPDSGNAYIGCDINAYACKPAVAAERDNAPPQLVSRTRKFKVLDAATPINAADTSAEGIKRAIGFVLACQAAGGAVPTADNEYAGCEGPCCVPEESANRLDASLFEEACEKPKDAIPVEECDAEASLAATNQINFEPYKLSRVLRAPTTGPTNKPAKCTTGAKLAPDFKKSITQRLFKDVHDTLKNEKLFSLRLPAGNQ